MWEMASANAGWGRRHIALVLGTLGIFLAASTVRNILLRARPRPAGAPAAAAGKPEEKKPRQIVARYPNHVWSVDRTRVWRWRIWPTWVLVAIDHFSRKVVASCHLEGPNAGWVVEALEDAFLRHGAPKHIISDREGVFVSEVFRDLLWRLYSARTHRHREAGVRRTSRFVRRVSACSGVLRKCSSAMPMTGFSRLIRFCPG